MEYDVDGTTCSLVIYLSEVSLLLLQAVTTASLSGACHRSYCLLTLIFPHIYSYFFLGGVVVSKVNLAKIYEKERTKKTKGNLHLQMTLILSFSEF